MSSCGCGEPVIGFLPPDQEARRQSLDADFFTAGTNSRNYGNSSRAVKEELDVYQRRVPQTD